jgi:DHA3 family macrolide efflux protein-like MFS transporter
MPPILRPLATRNVALLWGGLAMSAIGDQLFLVVLGWVAVQEFGTNAGLLTALQAAVMLVTALLAGRVADSMSHRQAMISADVLRAVVLGLMVVVWLGLGRPTGIMLVGSVLALAVGNALFRPALMAVVPAIAPESMLPATNALIDTTERIARLLGPGLIGIAAATLPLVHFVTIDVATFAVSALAVTASVTSRAQSAPSSRRDGIWASLSRGFVAVRRDPLLGFVLSVTGVINGAWYAAYFLGLPLMLVEGGVAGGIAAFGTVISGYGLTNLATTLIVGNRPISRYPARMIFGGNLFLGVGVLLLGLAGLVLPTHLLLAGLVGAALVSAIGGPMQDITVATRRQTILAPPDIAAGTRAFVVVNQAGLLLGLLASPLLFSLLGVAPTVMACGLAVLAASAAGLWRFSDETTL